MLRRWEMLDSRDVPRPHRRFRILRAGNDETRFRPPSGRSQQQFFQTRLAVRTIRAQITKLPLVRYVDRVIERGVDRAIEGESTWRTELVLEPSERWAASERKVQLITRDKRRREVLVVAATQFRERHGRIDVVERRHAIGRPQDPFADFGAVRHVRADNDGIGRTHRSGVITFQLGHRAVETDLRVGKTLQVAIVTIPRQIALEKQHVVSARRELTQQRAVRGRMTVAPRGGDRKAENDELHGSK